MISFNPHHKVHLINPFTVNIINPNLQIRSPGSGGDAHKLGDLRVSEMAELGHEPASLTGSRAHFSYSRVVIAVNDEGALHSVCRDQTKGVGASSQSSAPKETVLKRANPRELEGP